MKKFLMTCVAAGAVLSAAAQAVAPAIPRDEKIEQRVEEILGKMTLDEKIGQMCELTIDVLKDWKADPSKGWQMNEAQLDSVIGKYKVGSILNVPDGLAVTPQKWQEIITRIQEKSMEEIGIPDIYGVDQIHGTTSSPTSTAWTRSTAPPIRWAARSSRRASTWAPRSTVN